MALKWTAEHRPALVISDVNMPVLDGYDMCRAMKYDPRLRYVPVILLTSLSDPADVLRGLEVGADYYLIKPYDADYLLAHVETILTGPPAPDIAPESPIEIALAGERRMVTANRRQILTLHAGVPDLQIRGFRFGLERLRRRNCRGDHRGHKQRDDRNNQIPPPAPAASAGFQC